MDDPDDGASRVLYFTYYLTEDQPEARIEIHSHATGAKVAQVKGPGRKGLNPIFWNRSSGSEEWTAMWVEPGLYTLRAPAGP